MIPWAKGFTPPTRDEARQAIGAFPHEHAAAGARDIRRLGATACAEPRPGRSWADRACFAGGGRGWPPGAVSAPTDEADWLAADVEEGQTFDEYVDLCISRSGRPKPQRVPRGKTKILFVPIALGPADAATAPPVEELAAFAQAYLGGAAVGVLPPATVTLEDASQSRPGAFASRSKGWLKLPRELGGHRGAIQLRRGQHGRVSLFVDPVLGELSRAFKGLGDCFALVGVCCALDLHSHPSDLFVAGMAAGGSGVAVFSLCRYHPHLRMSPGDWDDFGYASTKARDVYYPDGAAARSRLKLGPAAPPYAALSAASKREYKLRAAKLLTHEILHLYAVDHCIHYKCLMQGTGHLREDFAAPVHLCPVDLRKLCWRNQCDAQSRYVALAGIFASWGLKDEQQFCLARSRELEDTGTIDLASDSDDSVIDLTSPSPRKRPRESG